MSRPPSRIWALYRHWVRGHLRSPAPSLAHTRETLLLGIIVGFVLIGSVAYVPSVVVAWDLGFFDTVIIDTLVYGAVVLLLLHQGLSFRQRSLGMLAVNWILAAYLLVRFGANGAGYLWLFVAPVLSSLLLGLRTGIVSLFLASLLVIVLGLMAWAGWFVWIDMPADQMALWAIMGGNYILISVLLVVSIAATMHGLEQAMLKLTQQADELIKTQDATIETVASLAEYRDSETGQHISRTQAYVRELADKLAEHPDFSGRLTPAYIEMLCKSAPLHDIGKVGVPDAILKKPGALTKQETEQMQLHPLHGRDALLRSSRRLGRNGFLELAAEIAYSHQERWDGSGYPEGLKGHDIPLSGRIMAVADVYDALISRRVYKPPMPHAEAMAFMRKQAGVLFDPDIVGVLDQVEERFREIARNYADSDEERRMLAEA